MAFLRDNSVYCIPNSTFSDSRQDIGGICIATSIVGFLGAGLQLKSIWPYRNKQRRWPSADFRIIICLALSDMFACLGVFSLAICFVKVKAPLEISANNVKVKYDLTIYQLVVTILEIVSIFSYLASYLWTLSYALDACFQIFHYDCPMIVYHIISWIIPLELVAVIEGINFGKYPHGCQLRDGQLIRLILSYILVPVVIFGNTFLLWLTYNKVKQRSRYTGTYTNTDRTALKKFKKKIFLMVFTFTLCWLPNIVSVSSDIYEISLLHKGQQYTGSMKSYNYRQFRISFAYVEALLNPLQGMFNYLIYRKAFKVTATDTRLFHNSLSSVSSNVSPFERFFGVGNRGASNKIVKRFADSSGDTEDETQSLGSSGRPNSYTSRLLGE